MNHRRTNLSNRPFSTMPRHRNEATTYLDLYKLQLEKQRLQCKLRGMEQQALQIQQRLGQIDLEMGALQQEAGVTAVNGAEGAPGELPAAQGASSPLLGRGIGIPRRSIPPSGDQSSGFNTIFVEY